MQLDYFQDHPIHQARDLGTAVPLMIHIDGVRLHKASGYNTENLVYNFSSGLTKGTSLAFKFILGQPPLWMMSRESNHFFVLVIRWFVNVLRTGRFPLAGFYQERLAYPREEFAPGHVSVFAGVKSDAKEKKAQHLCQGSFIVSSPSHFLMPTVRHEPPTHPNKQAQ